ncbi:phage holin family protein [Chromobacterium alkanivorans]|uniref:phage holin family protein n=1 Tax=Chromobacterium alkanivorans TaxID=1071719 RepID=UPI00196792BC|nr:phage holin family protein [Chromobacterium alkanivorans]MBN3005574.1 phage holin family protein [Chromobacterium alkanivorans]
MTLHLDIVNALLCIACCLRLILFTRGDASHRPWASALAYLLIVAFAALAITTLLKKPDAIGWAQLLINLVLAAALFSVSGNVVELFRPTSSNRQSLILRLLRREKWL